MSKKQCARNVYRFLRSASRAEARLEFRTMNLHYDMAAAWMVMYSEAAQ